MRWRLTREEISWAAFDWANSAFATTVMAGFFPLFFKQYWSYGADVTASTMKLGIANSSAGLLVTAISPFLGAVADSGGAKKKFLFFFTVMGVVMTGGLPLVAQGNWLPAVALYVLATVGFSGGIVFYDALLPSIADESRVDLVSALGYAFGYLGGGVLFGFNVWMVTSPETFGFADAAGAVKASFFCVAIWWALFSIPVFFFVPEPRAPQATGSKNPLSDGLRRLIRTFRHVRQLRHAWMFLLAYWCYIDGVDTVIRMAVDYGLSLGFEPSKLIMALLITQFVGFPAAIAFGRIGERLGPKRGIFGGIFVYLIIVVWASRMDSATEFFALAIGVGLVQGGVQALSRSLFTRMVPEGHGAEFFGFYNMVGKFGTIVGPVLVGWAGVVTGSPRISILSIALLFLVGGALLTRVDPARGTQQAAAFLARSEDK